MTDEEKAALEWLRVAFAAEGTSRGHWFPDANDMKQAATLKAMLAQPRLPEEPSEEAIRAMLAGGGWTPEGAEHMRESYRALHAHLTAPPKPKISILRALCIARTLKGEGELGDALRLLADEYTKANP